MSVKIVVDSACDLTKQRADALDLTFLSLKTIFGGEEYSDGITMSHREFYEKLIESGDMPSTSQIPPHDFEEVFARIKKDGDTAVVITLSAKLSGTFQSAAIAQEGYEDCVFLVDSETVSLGEQILVLLACRLRDEGRSAADIAQILEERKRDIRLIDLLDTLEYLRRGGRISGAAAIAGNLLSIKPVITVKDGEVAILGKARGSKNGNNMLIQEINKTNGIAFPFRLCSAIPVLTTACCKNILQTARHCGRGRYLTFRLPPSAARSEPMPARVPSASHFSPGHSIAAKGFSPPEYFPGSILTEHPPARMRPSPREAARKTAGKNRCPYRTTLQKTGLKGTWRRSLPPVPPVPYPDIVSVPF